VQLESLNNRTEVASSELARRPAIPEIELETVTLVHGRRFTDRELSCAVTTAFQNAQVDFLWLREDAILITSQ
jgi:hypothetical protein